MTIAVPVLPAARVRRPIGGSSVLDELLDPLERRRLSVDLAGIAAQRRRGEQAAHATVIG